MGSVAMKVLSLFSGVGGFDLGLERAGMETVFQCEWDKHATKILEKHWPHVPRWTDVSTLTGEHILSHAPVIDVVAWGSPCQDLSVAGKRAGLEGARSGLFHEGVRIIKELRELTNGKYPRISIWENVAGALSSGKGADFGQVLTEMDEAGACFSEWRILDAQYFGVPQRRRRVFLISVFDSATAARCPDPLLPVSESVRRDTETGNTARQEPASETATGFGSRSYGGWTETDTATTLSQRDHKGSMTMVVGSLAARDYKGVGNQYVNENKVVVEAFTKGKRPQTSTDDETWDENRPAPTLNAFDQGDTRATTVIVGSLQARDHKGANHEGARDGKLVTEPVLLDGTRVDDVRVYNPPVQTLKSRMGTGGNNVPVIGFSHTQGLSAQPSQDAWPTLRTEGNGMAVAIPIQDGRDMEKHQNGLGVAEEGAPAYTLDQTGAQAVAYSVREDAKANTFSATELDRANALSALRPSPQSHHAQMFIAEGTEGNGMAVAFQYSGDRNNRSVSVSEDVAYTLAANAQSKVQSINTQMAVRRLTPLECERLMGWPDDWTAGQSDTHRYKQCGNGVASPVATWIAQQLLNINK